MAIFGLRLYKIYGALEVIRRDEPTVDYVHYCDEGMVEETIVVYPSALSSFSRSCNSSKMCSRPLRCVVSRMRRVSSCVNGALGCDEYTKENKEAC